MASSPDNDGTGRHCQTTRVRQARREGVREKSAVKAPQVIHTGSNLVDMGRGAAHVHIAWATPTPGCDPRPGGHGESLRRIRGDAAGAQLGSGPANRCMVNVGTIDELPSERPAR